MIKKLRRKLVLIVMSVVTTMLLAIFFTMLYTVQKNNEQMSIVALRQALNTHNMHPFASEEKRLDEKPDFSNNRPPTPQKSAPQTRLPVLVAEMDKDGNISLISNQLYFIQETDVSAIVELAASKSNNVGILSDYTLRYLRENTKNGTRIAFIDIYIEQEMLKKQVFNSLLIGGLAMLSFFVLSLFLARWAVRPVETAWEQQKQFVANASHELKTPLTVILSNADMLRTEKNLEDSRNSRRMEHIHAEAVRMKQLVEDMLALAKSDIQEKTEIHSVVDFSYIVKSAVLMYEPIIYDEGKALSYEIENNLEVRADAPRLQQAVHILLDNAQKYSTQGSTIYVALSKTDNKGLLKISNQGTPIPKEELKKIFLRFYRMDESRSQHGSFGLGLSIAQNIIYAHKGSIWADSDGKSHNNFYISLPLI